MNTSRTRAERLLLLIGSLGPLGHLPASGTATVLVVGLPLYYLMHSWTVPVRIAVTLAFAASSVWVHHKGDRVLQTEDSRLLVWDELAGFLVAVVLLSEFTWRLAVIAFALERAMDIVKVPPARWVEQHWPGGWGVVGDDVIAGLWTSAALALLVKFTPQVVGLAG